MRPLRRSFANGEHHPSGFQLQSASHREDLRGSRLARRIAAERAGACAVRPAVLSAELGITASTMREIVDIVRVKRASFIAYAAEVEAMRLAAKKKSIRAAVTSQDVNSVLNALTWPDSAHVI